MKLFLHCSPSILFLTEDLLTSWFLDFFTRHQGTQFTYMNNKRSSWYKQFHEKA